MNQNNINISEKANVSSSAIFSVESGATLVIGDYVTIGKGVKIIVSSGQVRIGDWTTIHDYSLLLCGEYLNIGQHCWFGQNCVIDGSGGLNIGNGVRVGMYSQIWTHVAAGEQIEGCILYGKSPSQIDDDAWLVGTCTVGSGVNIGTKTICLAHSNITKSIPSNVVVAGSPARVKEKLNFYRSISSSEKWDMLKDWVASFCSEYNIEYSIEMESISIGNSAVLFLNESDYDNCEDGVCAFSLIGKKYKNINSVGESIVKYLSGNKARFYKDLK